jgi:hypothetical protein
VLLLVSEDSPNEKQKAIVVTNIQEIGNEVPAMLRA